MTVLIAYASLEGQTRKIAEFAEKQLRQAGVEVEMFDTSNKMEPVDFDPIDRVILAAPVHERRHPQTFEVFVAAHRADLQARPTLMLSVSLKAAFAEGREEAQEYLTEMEMRTRYSADQSLLVAGAVRSGGYEYFETQVLRYIVLRNHDFDPQDGPHEFTDWQQLKAVLAGLTSKAPAS